MNSLPKSFFLWLGHEDWVTTPLPSCMSSNSQPPAEPKPWAGDYDFSVLQLTHMERSVLIFLVDVSTICGLLHVVKGSSHHFVDRLIQKAKWNGTTHHASDSFLLHTLPPPCLLPPSFLDVSLSASDTVFISVMMGLQLILE